MKSSVYTTRLLKGLVALVAVCVATQSFAAFAEKHDFEAFSSGYSITNATDWSALGSDASIVTNIDYTYTAATMPLSQTYPGNPQTKVLQLDTQGDQLTNDVAVTGEPFVYIDQMVYLVPSDEDPTSITNDTSIQTALFLNSASNLVILCAADGSIEGAQFVPITNTNVLPETWVRLTITADYVTGNFPADGSVQDVDWFKFAVDGIELTSTSGYSTPTNWVDESFTQLPPDGGPWFVGANHLSADAATDELAGVSYMGTGMIDDLLVTTVEPTFVGGGSVSFFTIMTVVGANGSIDPVGDISIESGGTTSIVFTADHMYEIDTLLVDDVEVGAAAGLVEYTNTYAGVSADISNNVSFIVQRTEGAPATWYEGVLGLSLNPPTDDGDGYNLFQEYVAGLDPTANAAYAITSISKNGSDQLVITWDGADSPVVNSRLTVQGSATVGDTPAGIDGTAVYDGVSGVWTWTSTAAVSDTVKFVYLSADETPE